MTFIQCCGNIPSKGFLHVLCPRDGKNSYEPTGSVRFACGQHFIVVCWGTDVLALMLSISYQGIHTTRFLCRNWLRYSKPGCRAWQGDSMERVYAKHPAGDQFRLWWAYRRNTQQRGEVCLQNIWTINRDHKYWPQMRVYLFNKGKDADSLPPTSDALKLHINWAHYQTTVWLKQFRLRNAWIPKLVDRSLTPTTINWNQSFL